MALSPFFTPLLIALYTFINTTKITVYSELSYQSLSFHWVFAVGTVFTGQPKRQTLFFKLCPSLFLGELKTEIELSFWKRRHPSHASPLPLWSPKKRICIHMFPSELCPKMLLTDFIWKSEWKGKKNTLSRHGQCGWGKAELFTFDEKMTLEIKLPVFSS